MNKNKSHYKKPELTIHGTLKEKTTGNTASGFEANSKDYP